MRADRNLEQESAPPEVARKGDDVRRIFHRITGISDTPHDLQF